MRRRLRSICWAGAVACLFGAVQTSWGQENIAPLGTGFLGYAAADDNTRGTDYDHASTGAGAGSVNDSNMATRSDTWGGTASDVPYDYVGVEWGGPISSQIDSVRLTMATFFDGGWFGAGGAGAGRALTIADLAPEPRVQISVDGTGWFDIPSTNNYASQMLGHNIGGDAFPNPSTSPTVEFNFEAISNISGIRLFGEGGGNAGDDSGGFLGVYEFEVYTTPEPASGSLLCGALLLGLGFVRRIRR
ncbi:MAG: hypothetical protein KDA60_06585 [Planctomycetales bacterium]|nr:hypothetical protein [Planctomycetales bacterium]